MYGIGSTRRSAIALAGFLLMIGLTSAAQADPIQPFYTSPTWEALGVTGPPALIRPSRPMLPEFRV